MSGMTRRLLRLTGALASVVLMSSCSLADHAPWAEADYLTDGSDGRSPAPGAGVAVEVGKPMSYSLTSLKATTPGVNPRITDVTIYADDGITLVGVGVLDTTASVGALTVDTFPPEPYFRDYPEDRASYHAGLPTRPVPGGGRPWSLIGGLQTSRSGASLIRSVTVAYEVDGESHEQTFEINLNLCGYKGDPKSVRCEAPASE